MNLQEALKWADTFGAIQSDPPTGDAPALAPALRVLAARVREMNAALKAIPMPCPVCSYSTMHADSCVIGKAIYDENRRP